MGKMRMRILIFLCLWMGGASFLMAQRPRFRPQVHEINVQLFSANHVPELRDAYEDGPAFSTNFVNALRYKYHLDLNQSLRGGLLYRTARYTDPEQVPAGMDAYWSDKLDLEFRAGYEYALNLMRFQIYAAIEGIFGRAQEDYLFRDPGYVSGKKAYWTYGGAAILGMRYFLNTNWSVGIESEAYYLSNRLENTGDGHYNFQLFPGKESGFNFLSLQVAYHFKRMRKSCTCGKPGS